MSPDAPVLLVGLPEALADAVRDALPDTHVLIAADAAAAVPHLRAAPGIVVVDAAVIAPRAAQRVAEATTEGAVDDGPLLVLRAGAPELLDEISRLETHRGIAAVIGPETGASGIAQVVTGLLERTRAASAASVAAVDDALAALWERSRDTMLERVGMLEVAVAGLLQGTLDGEGRREAERVAHRVAGSAGTFGFAEASRVARRLETLLAAQADVTGDEAAELVVALRDSLEAPRAAGPAASSDDLVVVDVDEPVVRRRLLDALVQRGVRAVAWDRQPTVVSPRGLVVHLRDEDSHARLVRHLPPASPLPAIALVEPDRPDDRIAASRAGAFLTVTVDTEPGRVVDALLRRLDERRDGPTAPILVVDDDPLVHDGFRLFARQAGWTTAHADGARDALARLAVGDVALVVVDVDMGDVDGFTLARTIRSDPAHASLPLVFLTGHSDPATLERAFAAGADDFLGKPLDPVEAAARLSRLLRAGRGSSAGDELDALTGVPGRAACTRQVEQRLDEARGVGAPLALAMLRIDGLATLNRERGEPVADGFLRRLAHALDVERGPDAVVGRHGGAEFLLAMPGLTAQDAARRVRELLARVRHDGVPEPVRLVAGVGEHPRDGDDVTSLVAAARRATDLAGGRGSADQVVLSDDEARIVDVVMVEDDPALAALVEHGLQARGMRTRSIPDGTEAIDLLAGSDPQVRARVVLLDVDLPGASGLDVLRRLHADGALATTRVMMLTARTRESEVLAALEMGAFDHVSKPFSLPVLVERVRRALEV